MRKSGRSVPRGFVFEVVLKALQEFILTVPAQRLSPHGTFGPRVQAATCVQVTWKRELIAVEQDRGGWGQ